MLIPVGLNLMVFRHTETGILLRCTNRKRHRDQDGVETGLVQHALCLGHTVKKAVLE